MGIRKEPTEKDNCRACSARSIAIMELENYLIEKFGLIKVVLESPPDNYYVL